VISKYPNIWKRLQELAVVLMLLGAFAPLPDYVGASLSVLGGVLLLIAYRIILREERREREAGQSSSAAISSTDPM
jgi:uncharacterized membrane protein